MLKCKILKVVNTGRKIRHRYLLLKFEDLEATFASSIEKTWQGNDKEKYLDLGVCLLEPVRLRQQSSDVCSW